MFRRNAGAKINVRLLIVLIVVIGAIGVSLVVARQVRRGILSERALAAGQAAYEKQDWPTAARNLRDYLARNPDDLEVLRQYADALMSMRPLDIAAVISAYRRILQLDPLDEAASEKLALLYGGAGIGNFEELASLAKRRIQRDPNDKDAPLWLAEALARLNKKVEAREVLDAFIQRLEALPGRHVEYIRACAQMSSLAAGESAPKPETAEGEAPAQPQPAPGAEDSTGQPTPLGWLNRAVAYAPDSAEALVYRAQYHLRAAEAPDVNEVEKPALLALARKDLVAADALGTQDPRILYFLAGAWMLQGDLDRAAADLQVMDRLPPDVLAEHFFDISDWKVRRYLLGSQLAMRRGAVAEAAALADETLASLTEKQKGHRGLVLPSVVQVYVTAGRSADAKRCLDEYLALVQAQQVQIPSARALAALKALVEAAENRPYSVIDLLEPMAGNDPNNPQVLRLLADAYSRTGQAARAVNALEQYRRLNPQDQQAARELARQYARVGDFEKAFEVATDVESSDPTEVGFKLLRIGAGISRAIGRGQSAGAADLAALSAELAELRQQHPDRVDIRIFQSIIPAFLDRPEEAERELKLAIEECKDPLRAEIQLMRYYVGSGRLDDALGVCQAACNRRKDLAEPWLALSELQTMKQDYDSARRSLQQGSETVVDARAKRPLSTRLALLELAHGDRPAGIRLLKDLASDPQEIQARLLLLGTREIRDDPNAGEKLIGELRQAEGQNGLWWRLYQASLWLSADNWATKQQDIARLLQFCIDADPTWPAPVLALAAMYGRQGDSKRVEETYRQGLLGSPSATEIADRLLSLLVSQNRFADAEKVLRQIQNPRIATDWRVRLAVGAGDFSRAIDELKLKISNDRQDAASRVEMARLLYQETRDAAQALRYLDEAKTIAPNSRTLAAVKASILRTEGQSAEALRVLDDYVADYNNFEAYWMRAAYMAEAGELERAEQDYRKLTTFREGVAAGYELLGNFYAGTKRLDQAVAAVREGLRASPEELPLKRSLMRLLLSRDLPGDKEDALGILKELEKELPGDSELMMARAVERIREGTPQSTAEATDILEDIVRREPTAVNAHLYLIGIPMRERQYKTACDYAIRALESNPGNLALLLARARAELALGYVPMAGKLAQRALQQDPNSIDAVEVFVQAALSGDDRSLLEQARKLTDQAVRRNPASERLLALRSHVYAGLGQPKGAMPELEAYCRTEEGSSSITALLTLADLYRIAGDAAGADKLIGQAEQLDRSNQTVVHARFILLVSQERLDDLKQISSRYISATDQELPVIQRAAAMLLSFEPPELRQEGIKLLQHAVSLWPTSADARLKLASGLYQVGDAEAAERSYRTLLQQYPNDTRALNDLAWILQEQFGRYDEALELANKGLRLAPVSEHAYLLDTKGTILSKMPSRLADAKSSFEEILRLSSSDPRRQAATHLQLGHICAKLQDPAAAREHLEKALEIDRKDNVLTPQERAQIGRLIDELDSQTTPSPGDNPK